MKEVRLRLREKPNPPLEADTITPDAFSGKTLDQVKELPVYLGNRLGKLCDYFDIFGETSEKASDMLINVLGDTAQVKYIGTKMTAGKVVVEGNAGMHVGAQMTGGEILVQGNVDDWAGTEMSGGLMRITGSAGNHLGSAYRGSPDGMTGGCIVVDGDVQWECASFMRRGMVVIRGDSGPFLGAHMNGGEIFVFGRAAKRLGASAKGNGGFIACLGEVEALLPTYVYDSIYQPMFMKLYLRKLANELGVKEAEKFINASFKRYHGDLAAGGTSEIFVAS